MYSKSLIARVTLKEHISKLAVSTVSVDGLDMSYSHSPLTKVQKEKKTNIEGDCGKITLLLGNMRQRLKFQFVALEKLQLFTFQVTSITNIILGCQKL